MSLSRRRFIERTAFAAGGLAAIPLIEASADSEQTRALPTRVLGRTKQRVSLIGYGTAPLGSDNTTPDEAAAAVNLAIDLGVNYLDTAPIYGDPNSKYGNAEAKLKAVLAKRRKEVFLVTKVNAGQQSRDGVLRQLDASLKRLGTDHVDAVHIHNLGDFDMNLLFQPNGPIAGLKEARDKGLIRFIGTSGHMRPHRFVTAIETGDIDLTMNALNFADRNNYPFEELVLPAAKRHGTAVVAMKVLGGAVNWSYDGRTKGVFAEHYERAVRYSLGIPEVACAVIGMANEAEVRQAVEAARRFKPLSKEERETLLASGKPLARARGLYYGPVEG